MNKIYYKVLTIAGSDSGGGAGIQADLKTFSALGCFGMSVITALTAQNTKTVKSIYEVPPLFISEQIDAIMEDMGVDAVKIGMLHNSEVILTIANQLKKWKIKKIVLDPVMVSKSNHTLLQADAIKTLKTKLMPLASMITPNIPEAELMSGIQIKSKTEMKNAAKKLIDLGAQAVLLKGGHLSGNICHDYFISVESGILFEHWLENNRVNTQNTHGTGCTLSSAITAHLAQNKTVIDAVFLAKEYLVQAIKSGADFKLGNGHGPVHHFHSWW